MAIVPEWEYPRTHHIYHYIHLAVAEKKYAMRCKFDGEYIARVSDDRVFDIAHWHYEEGNQVLMLREQLDGSNSRHNEGGGKPGGRSFHVNPDGTIST